MHARQEACYMKIECRKRAEGDAFVACPTVGDA